MNQNNNRKLERLNKNTTSTALDLETLTAKYDNLLKEYNQIQANYIDYLNQNSDKNQSNNETLTTMTGKTFWGTGSAPSTSTTRARTLEECKALCASNNRCTGATFNATSHSRPMCWLRTGEANLSNGLKEDVAIVSQKMIYLNRMKTLNKELQDINKEISTLISTKGEKIYKNQVKMRKEKNNVLEQNRIQLDTQHKKIVSEIDEYESLNNEHNEEALKLKQNYAIYGVMVVLAIIALFLVAKMTGTSENTPVPAPMFQSGGSLSNKTYYGVFFIIFLAVIINTIYN
jgi:ElaB/YqjD/DUF883 family membrane-anchored ribosome-binding protein